MSISLVGKKLLVTGGSRGLGAALCERFAAEGCDVAINYVSNAERAKQVAAAVEKHGRKSVTLQADVGILADCKRLVKDSHEALGGLDIIINNAGWTKPCAFGDLDAMTEAEWDKCWAVNTKSNMHLLREALPIFNKNSEGGCFLITSSPYRHLSRLDSVSFGLLVPPRILGGARYGGLNVHPSMLPDFRGAAPIEHTLLAGRRKTGVTLQTLHPSKMDHGQILLQWPESGLEIPHPKFIKPAELRELLAPLGAMMLVHGIRNGLHVPPIEDLAPKLTANEEGSLRCAPKILPEDRRICWSEWTAEEIMRRHRIIGPLWNNLTVDNQEIRITFSDGFALEDTSTVTSSLPAGTPMLNLHEDSLSSSLWVKTADERLLRVDRIKVPGHGELSAHRWARKMPIFNGQAQDTQFGKDDVFSAADSNFK